MKEEVNTAVTCHEIIDVLKKSLLTLSFAKYKISPRLLHVYQINISTNQYVTIMLKKNQYTDTVRTGQRRLLIGLMRCNHSLSIIASKL